jgi:hypothetical protein
MHRICLTLASLIGLATPVFAADLDMPLLYKVESGVNVWAPQPPVSALPPPPLLVNQQVQVKLVLVNRHDEPSSSYVTGPRWPGYIGDYPARLPY